MKIEKELIGRIRLTFEGGPWHAVVKLPETEQVAVLVRGQAPDVYANVLDLTRSLNDGWVFEKRDDTW